MSRLAALALIAICIAACGSTQASAPIARPTSARSTGILAQLEAATDLAGARIGPSAAPATVVLTFASWCTHCKHELAILEVLRAAHPRVRILGVNYVAHETYAGRGGSAPLRAFLANAPWLRVIPAAEALFVALGSPPLVPTMWVFDRAGTLVETFDRRVRPPPDAAELAALVVTLGG